MIAKTLLRSFAGGIVSPELFGRLDLAKNQTGLADCRNFWTLPHGPAQNRSGFGYVLETKDSTLESRLIPFAFSVTQTMVLECGDQYVRFHTQGATLLEANQNIVSITQADPGVIEVTGHGYSNGDWVYASGIGGMTELNGRFFKIAGVTADTFELTDFAGNDIDTTGFGAFTAGGTVARVYEVATPFLEADLFGIHYVQSADVLTLVHPNYAPRELRRLGATNWQLSTISFAPTIGTPDAPTVTAGSGSGSISYSYVTTAIASDGLEESLASAADSVTNDLSGAGAYNEITPDTVTGAVRYRVYKLFNGLYGYIGETDGSAFRDDNITADISQTPPEANNPFNATNDYPAAVGYYEQRRCFAGTNNKPQNFWATRSATESNLSYSIPTRDDDSITFKVRAQKINAIRHIVPLSELLLLTSNLASDVQPIIIGEGAFKVAPQNSDILTPTSASPKPQAADAVIFANARGGRISELRYNWERDGFKPRDISVLAPHLFDDYTIRDMAYVEAPHRMVFAVRSDGGLLGLTYLPEHDVVAWHEHDTDGSFESVAAVSEGVDDVLYAVVQREIDGREVRYVERQRSRRFTDQADAFFVDAGSTYDGAATSTITNLWHLEGEEVAVLADGAVHPPVTVANGEITLEQEASTVQVGLPITADIKTLPLALELQALGQGTKININKAYLRVHRSSGIFTGPEYDKLTEYKQRTNEPYGSPPALVTDEIPITIPPKWTSGGGQVCVRQTDPLPITVLSMALEVAIGG